MSSVARAPAPDRRAQPRFGSRDSFRFKKTFGAPSRTREEEQRLKESANGTEWRLTALLGIVMATPGGGQQCSAPLRHHAVRRGLSLHVRRGLKTTSRLVPTGRGVRGGQRVLGRSN